MAGVEPYVVVALDVDSPDRARSLAARLTPERCRLKVGNELFTRAGPQLVEHLQGLGFDVFLDLKYHDIPNTVAAACRAAADLGVWMVNVHTLGGPRMMAAAREAIDGPANVRPPLLTGVTVLTSHDAEELALLGFHESPGEAVTRLGALALQAGLDGLVCSASEAATLRRAHGPGPVLVTPGVRPAGSATGDQRRVATPADARAQGTDYLVVGRPITGAAEPEAALAAITAELERDG